MHCPARPVELLRPQGTRQDRKASSGRWLTFLVGGLLSCTSSLGSAAPIIPAQTLSVFPNQVNQRVPVYVENATAVQGVNFQITLEHGGPDVTPGSRRGPRITNVDLTSGTIFSGNHDGQTNVVTLPQAWVAETATRTGSVLTSGVLAWLTIDTTGFQWNEAPFLIEFLDPLGSPTDFAGIAATVAPSQLRIVPILPEPGSYVMFLLAALGALLQRRHRIV